MSESSQATEKVGAKQKLNAFAHKLFGSTPGDGEMQPKEGFSYSLCGFGQNLICTIIGSYLTVFMTDAIGFPVIGVAILMLYELIHHNSYFISPLIFSYFLYYTTNFY